MKKYFLTALFVVAGLMAIIAISIISGWIPSWEIITVVGLVSYITILNGWFIDPEEIENFWENRSGK